jgi:hypothetical protein
VITFQTPWTGEAMKETGCCSELVMEAEPVWLGPLPPAVLKDSAATLRWEVEVEDGKWVRYPPLQQLVIESAFVRGNVDSVRVTVAAVLEFYPCKCEHTLRIAVPRLQFLLPNTPQSVAMSVVVRFFRCVASEPSSAWPPRGRSTTIIVPVRPSLVRPSPGW